MNRDRWWLLGPRTGWAQFSSGPSFKMLSIVRNCWQGLGDREWVGAQQCGLLLWGNIACELQITLQTVLRDYEYYGSFLCSHLHHWQELLVSPPYFLPIRRSLFWFQANPGSETVWKRPGDLLSCLWCHVGFSWSAWVSPLPCYSPMSFLSYSSWNMAIYSSLWSFFVRLGGWWQGTIFNHFFNITPLSILSYF